MKAKHILIISSEFPPQPGGIGTHAYQLASALHNKDLKVTVIVDQRSDNGILEQNFDSELPFSVIRIKRRKLRAVMYFDRIWRTLKLLRNTDVVIASGKFSLWNVSVCNVFFEKKSIAIIHGTEVNFKRFLLKKSIDIALQRFSTVVAVSNYSKSLIKHLECSVHVIPNGINLEDWKRENKLKNSMIGNPKLITVGRISERKGQAKVVGFLPQLIAQFPNIHYHCVGMVDSLNSVSILANELGVESHLTMHGAVSQQDLLHLLSQADIFVMLSTESVTGDVEGFGIALLEANTLGIPTIGAKNCGIEDAINDNISGVLIDSNDCISFINAIDIILTDYDKFSSGAKKWAFEHRWEKVIESYLELI